MPDDPAYLQQPGESGPAYAAFLTYRDLPVTGRGRTINAAWQAHSGHKTVAPGYFRGWARTWLWIERASVWDAEATRLELQATAKQRATRKERRRDQAAAFREVLAAPAAELLRRLDERSLDLRLFSGPEILQLAVVCGRVFPRVALLERLEDGEATELVGTSAWTGPMPDVATDEEHAAAVFAALEEAGWRPEPEPAAEVLQLQPPREAAG